MPDELKAVFLSYTSQDAPAARRICEALRASGVEVWFDLNELRGGDAWDQKIRRQIKECALFVPLISANTNARAEGYFRLEWKLAVDRSHLMADDSAFLFPVVIDDTPEPTARVPDRFREVQWTRLSVKDTPDSLARRVAKLLGGEAVQTKAATTPRRNWIKMGWAIIGLLFAFFYLIVPQIKKAFSNTPEPPRTSRAAKTETRQLVGKARAVALNGQWDEATREDFALTEQILKRAVELDPADGEAWAAAALCAYGQVEFGYDPSRRDMARSAAERAIKLAPDSTNAKLALACSYRFQPGATIDEAVRLQRELARRNPSDPFIVHQFSLLLESTGERPNVSEALASLEQLIESDDDDATALRLKSDLLFKLGRLEAASAALDQALKLRPSAGHLHASRLNQLLLRPDLAAAQAAVAQMPPAYLLTDLGAYSASRVWLWSGQPDRAIAILGAVPRDFLECRYYAGPRLFLSGLANQLAGRESAAATDWRTAQAQVEQRLSTEPGEPLWLYWQARLHAALGEKDAADASLRLFQERSAGQVSRYTHETWPILAALGRTDEALAHVGVGTPLLQRVARLAQLRHDPELRALRALPQFGEVEASLEKAVAQPIELPPSNPTSSP